MGRLIRLSYNGHITIGELTGYVYALDKARACLESALTIEAENIKRAPAIPSRIDVSIITVPSGHFISAEQAQQIQSSEFLQQIEHERVSLDDYRREAITQQAEAEREIGVAVEAAARAR